MNHPSSPRPPKWPYLLGDIVLLALACIVGLTAESPFSPLALSVVFGCVALGCMLAALPYLFDFFADQRAAAGELQQKLETQNAKFLHGAETLATTSAPELPGTPRCSLNVGSSRSRSKPTDALV